MNVTATVSDSEKYKNGMQPSSQVNGGKSKECDCNGERQWKVQEWNATLFPR